MEIARGGEEATEALGVAGPIVVAVAIDDEDFDSGRGGQGERGEEKNEAQRCHDQ